MTAFTAQGPVAKRSLVERTLLVLEVLLAVGAFAGALGFLLGWSAFDELSAQLPFGSTVLAGLALALVNGVLPALVVYGALHRRRWARAGHLLVGVVLVGWILVQVVVLGPPIHPLQAIYLVYGMVIAWLGELRLREHD